MARTHKMGRIVFLILVILVVATFLFPIAWTFITSLKPQGDILVPAKIRFEPTLSNYHTALFEKPFFHELFNSLVVSITSTVFVLIVSLPAAYSFSRFNTTNLHLLFFILSTRMFPAAVAAIPFFLVYKNLGLLDTRLAITLLYIYFNMSFATFLLYGFFKDIPEELEYSAMVDGYDRWTIFRKIVFPLIKPGAAVTAVFCLIFSWNEFLFGFLFTRREAKTLAVGVEEFWTSTGIQWGPMAAAVFMVILPTLIITIIMQRYIVRGLTFGAVKG